MADGRKGAPRAPRTQGRRTTLRVPPALEVAADDLSRELGISRNDALLRLAARGARLHDEEREIAEVRAARWAAVLAANARLAAYADDDDLFPSEEEARDAILASRYLS